MPRDFSNLIGNLEEGQAKELLEQLLPQMIDAEVIEVLNEVLDNDAKEDLAERWCDREHV